MSEYNTQNIVGRNDISLHQIPVCHKFLVTRYTALFSLAIKSYKTAIHKKTTDISPY